MCSFKMASLTRLILIVSFIVFVVLMAVGMLFWSVVVLVAFKKSIEETSN
jgi:hypothetical protein